MICPSCAHENRPGAKFCEECAGPLKRVCASCGSELRPTAKFCDECAAPVPGAAPAARPAAPADTRKVVTIVFADLVGSTALHERLEPESARRFMESYYAAMRGAVESQGGTVTQLLGDGVKAVFGIPRVAEDDAIRAVRAAVAMQDAFRALADAQRGAVGATGLRVAVNTGEVVANDATEIIGDPVNVAARLQEQGKDGDVVVGESTHRLVSTLVTLELLGSFALKGRSEAVKAYRVVSLERPAGAATAPFVGRDEELARLAAVYETAIEKPAAALAVLVGSPGLGKSRLIDEFARRRGEDASVVHAHCDAAGGATFTPLAGALRDLLGIEAGASAEALRAAIESRLPEADADRARVAGGVASLLAGSPASPEETFFVVRRLLGALAKQKPVVLVIDDLHWAEPLLLDLVEHLIQWGSGVALFVLIGSRPELRELRSSLVTPGGLVSDVVTLGGLDAGAAMRLAANVIGASDLPAAVAAKVLATSEGNPLFVGELVRMLVQEGALAREGDRWVVGANLAAFEMPPTIHALLAARIERLRPEERTVLERAAVVGRHFSRSAIAALLPGGTGDLDARLEALRRTELIERDTGWLLGEPVLRFHHVLIRDAAYRRLLKGTRAELHAKLADWIEAQVGDAAEHDETIGWHLEQAHQFLRELGPLDDAGKRLGERAATRLAAAGRRALARDDLPVASDLLGRAIDRLDTDDPARADLALDWCEALLASGDVGPAAAAIEMLGRFSADSERLRAWHTCFAGQHTVLTAPSALHATATAVATAADELTALGDAAGEAKAHFVHALALSRLGKVGACEAALDRALAAARRAGDRRRANTVLAIAPLAALWGPSPVTRASGRCLDVVRVLRITQGAPAVEAVALSCQGVLEALRGRGDAARRMIASARKMVEELGITQRLLEADVFGGLVELLEGDAPAAERSLRGAYEGLRDLGLGIDAARAAALLARALLAQGRVAEAEALSHESESLAGDDLKAAIAWRGVRAEALARRGEHAAAVELASKAVELAAATDALLDHADARLALAAALRAAGRRSDADAEERRARDLWQAKGATLLAERAPLAAARAEPAVATSVPRTAHAPRRRPVRPNFAFEEMRRAEAAVAARDARALEALYRRDVEIVDHQFGITYGHAEIVERVRSIIDDSTESAFEHEPLASLGDALALCRMRSTASGSTAYGISIGATEVPYLLLIEADEQGSARAIEIYGEDKLGDSVARLYERYAALEPAGPERERAARAAFSLGTPLRAGGDFERMAEALAPDFVGVDHRHLSNWSLQGAAAYVAHLRALREVADDIEFRQLDVVALAPNAQLMRVLHTGTDRAGGGVYERPFLSLFATDAAGRLARAEWFDADREAEALARLDALAGDAAPKPPVRRRVRSNHASAVLARFETAFTARDAAAWEAEFDASLTVIAHPTGASYGRDGHLRSLHRLAQSQDPALHFEPIATLGDDLVLAHRRVAASGATTARYDVGPYEREEFVLSEIGASGRTVSIEIFGSDRLAEAVVRLYERHAALLPEGPSRTRAAALAQSVAILSGPIDLDEMAAAFAPDLRVVDHRVLSTWTSESGAAHVGHFRLHLDLAPDTAARIDEVLAIEPDGMVVRDCWFGTSRDSGGAFENRLCTVYRFDGAGRIARVECFEAEHEVRALARFEALVQEHAAPPVSPRRVRANAASRSAARFIAALDARDADALPGLFDDTLRVVHHPSGSSYGRREMLTTWRSALRAERLEFRGEPIATLGDTLVLSRQVTAVEGLRESHLADFGSTEVDEISLVETDAAGRWLRVELFAPDRLGDAVVRLHERHAEQMPEGPARTRAQATARTVAVVATGGFHRDGRFDLDAYEAVFRPDVEIVDHKLVGGGASRGTETQFRLMAATTEIGEQVTSRCREVLALTPDALLLRWLVTGVSRESGGAFEWAFLRLFVFGDDGRVARYELFDDDREAEALARFDALAGRSSEAPAEPFANAASRLVARGMHEFWTARDWDGIVAMISPAIRMDDRRRIVRLEIGYDQFIAQFRMVFDQPGSRWSAQLLATRGERLSLTRTRFEAEVADGGGPLAIDDHLSLAELDAEGRIVAFVTFDLVDEDAAWAELDARFEADASAAHGRVVGEFVRAIARRDWNAVAALCGPAFVEHDHRSLAVLGTTRGAEAWMRNFRALVELAPDTIYRSHHVRTAAGGFLSVGTWQGSREGGRYEIPLVAVLAVDSHGAIARADLYEPDQHDEALARFAALAAPAPASEPFGNAAWRANRALGGASNARDFARIEALLAPSLLFEDRRRLNRLTMSRDEALAHYRFLQEVPGLRFSAQLLATRGERLALGRTRIDGSVAGGGGALEGEVLDLAELDADGCIVANLLFDLEDEDAAYAELDARFEAGEGAEHSAQTGFLRSFRAALVQRDWDAIAASLAEDFVGSDHRLVGWGTLRGVAFVDAFRSMAALAPDVRMRWDHLRTARGAMLAEAVWIGTREGGPFESPFVFTSEFDASGRLLRCDFFDPHRIGRALARFAELTAPATTPQRFANAATEIAEPLIAAVVENDWPRYEALFAETFRGFDRRRMVQLEFDRDAHFAFARELAEGRRARGRSETLATRGERLALLRLTFEFEDADVGPSEVASLLVAEVDERGRFVAYVRFDDDDLDAAYAELDARFEAGEGAAHPHALAAHVGTNAAIRSRDWDALAAQCAPTFRMRDHRLLGWGTIANDATTFVRVVQSAVELAPDARYRDDHLRICARGTFAAMALCGTREGGAFENPFLRVTEVDAQGRTLCHDTYDVSDLDRALARFAEIAAPAVAEGRFENAASRAWREVNEAWIARDLERFAAPHAAALRYRDHRRLFELDLDRAGFVDFTRPLIEMRAGRASLELVATRGERLALMHSTMEMADEAIGPSVIESLMMIEVDERGDIAAYDRWDLEDEDAAWAELDARWNTGEGAQYAALRVMRGFGAALERRDWDATAACYAPDFVGHDHRLVSWGTVHGPSALMRALEEMVVLAPDARMRLNHRRACAHGTISDITWVGTRDGGAFESPFVNVAEAGADGRIVRADFYDPHHLDRALARFAELRASERRDPLAALEKPNAANVAMDRWQAAFDAEDWEGMRALGAPGFRIEDRRRHAHISYDADTAIADWRRVRAAGVRPERRALGKAGERIAIERILWTGGGADAPFEVEFVWVTEVDEAGCFTASVAFDADAQDAARREAWSRWAAIDPDVAPVLDGILAITDAWNAQDRARLRACHAESLVVEDHRLAGIGRIVGADAYVETNAVLWDLAPDQRIAFGWTLPAVDRHGAVGILRREGRLPDGGAFESEYVTLTRRSGGLVTHLEFFELGALDAALARFEEVRPDPLRIPPNEAVHAQARMAALTAAADWDGMRALCAPAAFDDRRRGLRVAGGCDTIVASARFLRESGQRPSHTLLATAGGRLALQRALWRDHPDRPVSEAEMLELIEVNERGEIVALVLFDADDRAAAAHELADRYARKTRPESVERMRERQAVWRTRDFGRLRALLPDDFVFDDRRRTGLGRIEGADAYVASVAALDELSADAVVGQPLYYLADEPHASLSIAHSFGTLAEGGAFESIYAMITLHGPGGMIGAELFELEDLEAAKARFEELRPHERSPSGPLGIPPTAATRMRDRHRDAFVARDWDAMRALTGAGFVYDDRGKLALVHGGVEEWIASMEFTTQPGFRSDSTLIGTLGDRIVLDQIRWFGKPDGDAFEFERVRLLEVGADGLLRAVLFFDPDDRAAAFSEAGERFRAGEAAGCPAQGAVEALFAAWRARDWAAARAVLTDVAAIHDHRRLGFGTLTPEAWSESWRVGVELAPDVGGEPIRLLAWNEHGRVMLLRVFGTRDGGAFENVLVTLLVAVAGRLRHYEFFESDDTERAIARFGELCGDLDRIGQGRA